MNTVKSYIDYLENSWLFFQIYEVDFFLPRENTFIQVSQNFTLPETEERELRAITSAANEQKELMTCLVVTERDKKTLEREGMQIQVVPLYEFLLLGLES